MLSQFLIISIHEQHYVEFSRIDPFDEISNELGESLRCSSVKIISLIIDRFEDDSSEFLLKLISAFELNCPDKLFDSLDNQLRIRFFGIDCKVDLLNNLNCLKKLAEVSKWRLLETGIYLRNRFAQDLIAHLEFKKKLDQTSFISSVSQILKNKIGPILGYRCLSALSMHRYLPDIEQSTLIDHYSVVLGYLDKRCKTSYRILAIQTLSTLNYRVTIKKLQSVIKNLIKDTSELIENLFEISKLDKSYILIHFLDILMAVSDFIPHSIELIGSHRNCSYLIKLLNIGFDNSISMTYFSQLFVKIICCESSSKNIIPILIQKLNNVLILMTKNPKDEDLISETNFVLDIFSKSVRSGRHIIELNSILLNLKLVVLNSAFSFFVVSSTILLKELSSLNSLHKRDNALLYSCSVEMLFKIIEETCNESMAIHLGTLALSIYIQNNNFVDAKFLEKCLRKLAKCSLPAVIQGFVVFFSYMLLQNNIKILTYLSELHFEGKLGLKILFDKWLLHQPKFIGPNVKEISFKALQLIYEANLPILIHLSVIGLKPSHKNPSPDIFLRHKILSLICLAYIHEMRLEKINKLNKDKNAEEMTQKMIEDYAAGRMETETDNYIVDEDDFEVDIKMNFSDDENILPQNIQRGGLRALETGSQSYLSGLLGFDDLDNDEFDESTENQLKYYPVITGKPIIDVLKELLLKLKISDYTRSINRSLDLKTKEILDNL